MGWSAFGARFIYNTRMGMRFQQVYEDRESHRLMKIEEDCFVPVDTGTKSSFGGTL
jgi:hypothetical protein